MTENGYENLGGVIIRLRKERNMSSADLLIKMQLGNCDISSVTLKRIENGVRAVREKELSVLAEIFGITPEELLGMRNS